MYALYFEEDWELLGVFNSKTQSILMGKMLSRDRGRPVVSIFNRADGSTAVYCKFSAGKQTYDGGCCPPEWTKPPTDAVISKSAQR